MAEVAMQYNDGYSEVMVSFANNVHTPEGGMHEEGFKRALTNALNAYGRKIKLLKDDEKVSGEDCREGLTAVISVKLTDAQFEGPDQGQAGQQRDPHLGEQHRQRKLEIYLEGEPPPWAGPFWTRPSQPTGPGRPQSGPGSPSAARPPWAEPPCPISCGTATRPTRS